MTLCTSCNLKEVTSPNLTGELCTSCYFESRSSPTLNDNPIPTEEPNTQDTSNITTTKEGLVGEFITPIENGKEEKEESLPIVSQSNQKRIEGLKYCQSCFERYGNSLVLATREWTDGHFYCDDCFNPLMDNIIRPNEEQSRIIRENLPSLDSSKPILNQIYEILEIPKELRFQRSDEALNHRSDIFAFHAPMVLNRTIEETKNFIDQLKSIVFTINVILEPNTQYINEVKRDAREKNNVSSIEKGKKEHSRAPSKVKQSQDQKTADTIFKLQMPFPDGHNNDCSCSICKEIRMKRLEKYLEFNKSVYDADRPRRIQEFEKKIK